MLLPLAPPSLPPFLLCFICQVERTKGQAFEAGFAPISRLGDASHNSRRSRSDGNIHQRDVRPAAPSTGERNSEGEREAREGCKERRSRLRPQKVSSLIVDEGARDEVRLTLARGV